MDRWMDVWERRRRREYSERLLLYYTTTQNSHRRYGGGGAENFLFIIIIIIIDRGRAAGSLESRRKSTRTRAVKRTRTGIFRFGSANTCTQDNVLAEFSTDCPGWLVGSQWMSDRSLLSVALVARTQSGCTSTLYTGAGYPSSADPNCSECWPNSRLRSNSSGTPYPENHKRLDDTTTTDGAYFDQFELDPNARSYPFNDLSIARHSRTIRTLSDVLERRRTAKHDMRKGYRI